jgi:hypothetical protein
MRLLFACCWLFASEAMALYARAAEPVGLFVAVGYGGRRISSRDGVQWENDQRWSDTVADDDNVLCNIAFGQGRFIAVGGGAKLGHILSTRSGKEWQRLSSLEGRVATIAFGKSRFVATHGAELLFSTDGDTFHPGEKLAIKGSVHTRRSAFGDTEAGQMFVIIGDVYLGEGNGRVGWRGSTLDGEHWASSALDTPAANDIAYGAGHFVIAGAGGLIEASHDGSNWRRCAIVASKDFTRVIWTGKRFLVTGPDTAWTSSDGLAWEPERASIPCQLVWARDGWLALGFSWGDGIWRATDDLLQWKKLSVPPGPSLEAIAFGGFETNR